MNETHAKRKRDHLRICREEDVRARDVTTGLQRYRLRHCALPELRLDKVDLGTPFLGKKLRAPFLISAITGGTAPARQINLNLATAAQALGLAMGVGSQRAAIEHPRQARTYQVRAVAPDILLFANLGAVQLNYGYGLAECHQAVDMIGADALVLHLNPLQEALQPHGNTNFAGLLDKIAVICRDLGAPVIIKEVGWGISESTARQLAAAGVAAIDVSGAGGTSWSEVEKHRAESDFQRRVAASFARWGMPTAECILQAQRGAPNLPLIASGGIYTGPEAAVALALGANLVGLARPLLEPATHSAEAVAAELEVLIAGLRIAMFAAGIPDIPSFREAQLDEETRPSGCGE
jgi:isopentenyl-diphosphate delta-isomerase